MNRIRFWCKGKYRKYDRNMLHGDYSGPDSKP